LLSAPFSVWWLAYFTYVPMFWALRDDTPRSNRWLAVLYGTVGVGILFRWIAQTIVLFSNIPTAFAIGVLVLFALVFGLPYLLYWTLVHPLRRRLGPWWVLAFPSAWVVIEFLSMHLLLFPYSHAGSQYRHALTWQLASVTGGWGITWLILFTNSALAEALYRFREGRRPPVYILSAAVAALSLTILYGSYRYRAVEAVLADAPTIRVAQLQTDVTMTERLNEPPLNRKPRKNGKFIKSANCARPGDPAGDIAKVAKRIKAPIVVGAGSIEGNTREDRKVYNSIYFFDANGKITQRYDKLVPLPFGEYLPLANVFPFLRDWIKGPGNFYRGTDPVVFQADGFTFSTPICYEAILPAVCARYNDPDLLINITNDGWFGDTAAPHQHAMLSAMRATELGKPMIRTAYTGVSFVVEPHGRIIYETEPFEAVNRVVTVRAGRVPSLFATLTPIQIQIPFIGSPIVLTASDWFVYLCGLGLTGALLVMPWVRRRRDR
jgi:apolipoprotein N-acyltransferase